MAHDMKHSEKTRPDTFAGSAPTGRGFDAAEDAFWRKQYEREGYFQKGMTWDDYEPAYRFGYDWHERHMGRKFDDVEPDMGRQWDKVKAKSRLAWDNAKHAVRAAWDRLEGAVRDKKHAEHR